MKNTLKSPIMMALVGSVLFAPTHVLAAPDASAFKLLNKNRTVTLADCTVSGIDGTANLKLGLDSGVASVSLPASFKKAAMKIGAKGSKFAACGVSDVDPTQPVLFLKSSVSATPTEHDLRLSDFEKAESISGACSTVRSWPGTFIYKTVGSHHFTDVRRNTIGLIMKNGSSVPTPSCIDIISSNGTKVGDFGFYARGAGGYARYYGGVGCGDTINGQILASRARKAAGNDSVYARIGTTCYGPITASKCVGSKAC